MEKDGKQRGNRLLAATGVGVVLTVFALYLRTLAPTVLYYDRPFLLDSVMLQVQAAVLGITHPTGYPTWVLLTHLFTYLPFGDVAYRTNLSSAVYAALAVLAVYAAGYLLSRRVVAAAAGALAFGVSTTFWSQAVITEVYTLNALLIALTVLALLLWRERRTEPRGDRYLLLAAFLMGFSLTNHMTSGLLIPAGLLFVSVVEWRKLLEWKLALKAAGLFLLALTPYLYLPIRASMDPPMNEADPTSFGRFWYLVSGGDLNSVFGTIGLSGLPGRFALYGGSLYENFNWGMLVAGVVGMGAMLLWDRAGAVLVGSLFLGWLLYAIEYNIFDVEIYFIPTFLMFALWISAGTGVILDEAWSAAARLSGSRRGAVLAALSVALALLPLAGAWDTYARNDMSDDYRGREVIETVAGKALPNSTILQHRSEMWYMVLVEKRRRDLTIIDPFNASRVRYTDIVWPDDIDYMTTNLRYGTNDPTGVTTAREAAKNGPVYILQQDSANPEDFREAGFKIVRVEKGVLYELVPPGGKKYSGGPVVS